MENLSDRSVAYTTNKAHAKYLSDCQKYPKQHLYASQPANRNTIMYDHKSSSNLNDMSIVNHHSSRAPAAQNQANLANAKRMKQTFMSLDN